MKVLQPDYYDEFECTADKCKDTCCYGWSITIDKKTFSKYKKVNGEFGALLRKNIRRCRKNSSDTNYGEFIKKKDNNKCYFLNDNNLCEIYINKGPQFMCVTCKIYPRLIEKYRMENDEYFIERNLTLSCPSVAEKLVDNKGKITFTIKNETVDDTTAKYHIKDNRAKELYNLLWEGRSFSIEIAQFGEIPIWKRLVFIKITEGRLQKLLDSNEFLEVNEVIENLKNEITKQDVIDSLDTIGEVDNIVKLKLINSIIKERVNMGVGNNTFKRMIGNIGEFIKDKTEEDIKLMLSEKQIEFDEYFKNKEYILENYIVYSLYTTYMKALMTKDLNKEIFLLMISYSIIKLFLLTTWIKNNGELTNEEIIDVLYSYSREMEHSLFFKQTLYEEMKTKGYDSIGYLVTMIY